MNKIYIFLIVLLSFSCTDGGQRKQSESEILQEVKLSKLEQLMLLPRDSVMDYYDLSNDSISDFPDLSGYTIKSLDLSHNRLDTLIVNYLPIGIVVLDISHNCLQSDLFIHEKEIPQLKELYLSGNNIERFKSSCRLLKRLDLSDNNLIGVSLVNGDLNYIDISNNAQLSNIVDFPHRYIDTVIYHNIANNNPLVSRFELPLIVE